MLGPSCESPPHAFLSARINLKPRDHLNSSPLGKLTRLTPESAAAGSRAVCWRSASGVAPEAIGRVALLGGPSPARFLDSPNFNISVSKNGRHCPGNRLVCVMGANDDNSRRCACELRTDCVGEAPVALVPGPRL